MTDLAAVQAALQTVVDPNTGKDLVSTKALKNLQVQGADVSFEVTLGYPAKSQIPALVRNNFARIAMPPAHRLASGLMETR